MINIRKSVPDIKCILWSISIIAINSRVNRIHKGSVGNCKVRVLFKERFSNLVPYKTILNVYETRARELRGNRG